MAKKKPKSTFGRIIIGLIRAPAVLAIIWPVLLVVVCFFAWHRWGAEHINRHYHSLKLEQVSITPMPEYIRSDVVEWVFEATDLSNLALVDVQATAQIANAFATSPWVEDVLRVQKTSSGKVDVHVSYRAPVGMVRVISQHHEVEGVSFFPVDANGILLPTADFSQADTRNYIHLIIEDSYPLSNIGSSFGDTRVTDAAALATVLLPHQEKLRVKEITVTPRAPHDERPVTLNVVMSTGKVVVWGSAPGKELASEPKAKLKLTTLLNDPNVRSLNLHIANPAGRGLLR